MKNSKYCTASSVLEKLEQYIKDGYCRRVDDVYSELSIFDWWIYTLSVSNMKKMRIFLKEAIRLGFDGYVCFKLGASGCANGMWAYKEESTDGYSPDGDFIYRSFSPDYTYWSFSINGTIFPSANEGGYNSLRTPNMLEKAMEEHNALSTM